MAGPAPQEPVKVTFTSLFCLLFRTFPLLPRCLCTFVHVSGDCVMTDSGELTVPLLFSETCTELRELVFLQ